MQILEEHKKFFNNIPAKKKHTIKEKQTKLSLYPQNDIILVKVDNGIIGNKIKKCDYLSYSNVCSNLIELKGTIINKAYEQIESTITYLQGNDNYKELLNKQKVKAIIASPIKQKIPQGMCSKQKSLAKKIASLNQVRVDNIHNLIIHVKIIPGLEKVIDKGTVVYCSNKVPLDIE